MSNTLQLVIVAAILAGTAAWIVYSLVSKRGKGRLSRCAGCALAETCAKQRSPRSPRSPRNTPRDCCERKNPPGNSLP